ncbi:hypothetical protein [Thalassospira marina]|uniref:hypothetical protein n=1 Tax=Thalassospira marina TaxID=2048283 RepID=UPI0012FEF94B|nr:hypothetical protein [Thalassospira marina]
MKTTCYCPEKKPSELNIITECARCQKEIDRKKVKKKSTAPKIIAAIVAAGAIHNISSRSGEDRYPVGVEYELMSSCINGSQNTFLEGFLRAKTQVCSCLVEKTVEDVAYDEYKKSPRKFAAVMRDNLSACY